MKIYYSQNMNTWRNVWEIITYYTFTSQYKPMHDCWEIWKIASWSWGQKYFWLKKCEIYLYRLNPCHILISSPCIIKIIKFLFYLFIDQQFESEKQKYFIHADLITKVVVTWILWRSGLNSTFSIFFVDSAPLLLLKQGTLVVVTLDLECEHRYSTR